MPVNLVGKVFGNYKVTKLLGEGGMGSVYLGEHPLIGKKVAIKVLHDELAQKEDIVSRFFTEAKAVNDIKHENIVDIVDFGKQKDDNANDLVYLVMEFLEGESLNDRLKRGGLSQNEAVHIVMQTASALQTSHEKGIVHRDLKPDNIFLIKRGQDACFVKLLDFGIAKVTGGDNNNKTRTGSVLGTPAYMSPEQCDGRGNIDYRADVYALGMVLYELVTGRVAFVGEGFGEILVAQLTQAAPPPTTFNPAITPGLEAIIMRCLEKSRDMRFQSMEEMRQALENSGSYVAPRSTGLNRQISGQTGQHQLSHPNDQTMMGQAGINRPTTLSGSTGEAMGQPAPVASGSKMPLIMGLAVLLLGGGGAGVYFGVLKKDNGKEVKPPIAAINEPKKVEIINVLIDSTPKGARVMRAGATEPLGTTPFETKLKKGEPAFDVVLEIDGYKSATRTVTSERDRDLLVALEKEEKPIAAVLPPPDKPASSPTKKHSEPKSKKNTDKGLDVKPVPDKKHVDPDGVLAPSL